MRPFCIVSVSLALLVYAAAAMPGDRNRPIVKIAALNATSDIVDIAVGTPDLSTLVTALKAAGLVTTLQGTGPFTVFAPSNEAFNSLPTGALNNLLKPENKAQLVDLLTYHVLAADLFSPELLDGFKFKTIEGMYVTSRVSGSDVFINNAKVTTANVKASNGVVHIIDAVLIPGPTPGPPPLDNIVDIAGGTPDLSTLVTALKAAGLINTLKGPGPFTVFAPTNEAFNALPVGDLADLLKKANRDQLIDVLTYHVVAGDIHARDIKDGEKITTVEGKSLTATVNSDGVFINNAKVITADIDASNGVVHVIDAVLIPDPPLVNHLWFRGFKGGGFNVYECGEVDAGPRMPASLFEPSNKKELQEYIDITLALYIEFPATLTALEVGRCRTNNYNISDGGTTAEWAPKLLMEGICAKQCHCDFGNTTFALPKCTDEPDEPTAGRFCSLCGPKYNKPIVVNLYRCAQPFNPVLCPGPKNQASK